MRRRKLLIADDHSLFRRGLRAAVEEASRLGGDEFVIFEASDGIRALEDIQTLKPDFAMLDLAMPGLDGLAVAEKVCAADSATAIIVMTMYSDEAYLRRAFDIGAVAYLLKDDAEAAIAECLEAVSRGDTFVSRSMRRDTVRPALPPSGDRARDMLGLLTRVQREVLVHVGDYRTSKEIAEMMGVSYRTVQNHRNAIARTLGIQGANKLLEFATRNRKYR